MKGLKCIKLLIFCITCLLSLSLYLDANAITITTEATPTGRKTTVTRVICKYQDGSSLASAAGINYCPSPISSIQNQSDLTAIHTYSGIPINEGYYYRGFISLKSAVGEPELLWRIDTNDNIFDIIEIKEITNDSMFTETIYILDNGCNRVNSAGTWVCEHSYGKTYAKFYEVTLRAKSTGNYAWMFGYGTTNALIYNSRDLVSPSDGNLPLLTLYSIDEFAPGTPSDQQNQEDRDNIEQQSSSTESEATDQGDEATQTGTSLFSAFTQLLGALTNVSGNSCTLPAMQVYSLNLGNLNLCQYDIPPQIMALVSIGMVFIIIPLGINLVKKMISLYKEITG